MPGDGEDPPAQVLVITAEGWKVAGDLQEHLTEQVLGLCSPLGAQIAEDLGGQVPVDLRGAPRT